MLFGELENELNDGNDDEAVRGRQDLELGRLFAGRAEGLLDVAIPVFAQQFGVLGGLDVQGDYFAGKPGGKFNALARDVAPAINGNNGDGRLAESCRIDGNPAIGEELHRVVVAADNGEENNRQRNEQQRNPGALTELRNQHNDDGDSRDQRAQPVDERAPHPAGTALPAPVHDHAGLRKREGQKSAHGIERDEPIGDATKKNEQAAAEYCQDNDAIGIDEAAPAIAESVGKVVILRDGAAEAREIGEGGVGGERQDEKNRADGQIVEIAFAENGGDEHGEKALVTRLAGIGGDDAVGLHEIGNSRQEHRQDKNNHGEGTLSVLHGGLAEGLDAVADGLDAGQCRATTGEDFQQQPVSDGLGDGRRRRKGSHGGWMSAAEENTNHACDDGDQQGTDKKIGGKREGQASIAHATEIDDGDDDQNADADRNGVRQQGRNGGDQGADSRGNAYGGGEDIVGEERGCGKQGCGRAQVEARHGVRAAAGGIGGDGLAIREVHDYEQRDDGGTDGNDVANAKKAERNQKAESGFRAVGGGAQAIETKDGDALCRADSFGALVAGFDGLADYEIKYVHERLAPKYTIPAGMRQIDVGTAEGVFELCGRGDGGR